MQLSASQKYICTVSSCVSRKSGNKDFKLFSIDYGVKSKQPANLLKQNPVKQPTMEYFAKIVNDWRSLTIF